MEENYDHLISVQDTSEAEETLVSYCFHVQDIKGIDDLRPRHFYRQQLKSAFAYILQRYDERRQIDIVEYMTSLEKEDRRRFADHIQGCPVCMSPQLMSDVIINGYHCRQLAIAGREITTDAMRTGAIAAEVASIAAKKVEIESADKRDFTDKLVERADYYQRAKQEYDTGVGITIEPGEYMIIGARPSIGKTAMMLQMFLHIAAEGLRPLFLSAEMSVGRLIDRMITSISGIPNRELHESKNVGAITEAMDFLASCDLNVVDVSGRKADCCILSEIRKHGAEVAFVDYVQLLEAEGYNETERVSNVSRCLAKATKLSGAAIIAASQLNRNSEYRASGVPVLADLRQSGSLEQDADKVVLLHREKAETTETITIVMAKNRNGPLKKTSGIWDGEAGTIGCYVN